MIAEKELGAATLNEMPFTADEMSAWGYLAWRLLPDGAVMAVGPMTFGNGRLYVDVNRDGYSDAYCYDIVELAVAGMEYFDPVRDLEPAGWKRHPYSGRRRPDGDATREYVNR